MSSETPNDIDRAAIEEAAQRVAEQSALRKVRKTLDDIEQGQARQRKVLAIVLVASVIAVLCVAFVFWQFFFKNRELHRGPPIEIPRSVDKKS